MKSISDAIKQIVMQRPFLEDGLAEGIINYSALSRTLKKEIEPLVQKECSDIAMVVAIKRLADDLEKNKKERKKWRNFVGDITLRSQITEFTFLQSESIIPRFSQLLKIIHKFPDQFLTCTSGMMELTILISSALNSQVEKTFAREKLISRYDGLSAIVMRISADITRTPGVYYLILKQLAWENVNIIEVVSTFREFTVILESRDIDRGFSILKKFLWR
jgi:aspartokinase